MKPMDPAEVLEDDLRLAKACLRGDADALRELDGMLSATRAVAERIVPGASDDILQRVRLRILTSADGRAPALSEYLAKGALAAWLRVVVTREALDERRRTQLGEAPSDSAPIGGGDPEIEHLRSLYGAACRRAFEAAASSLDAEERTVLRLYHVDRLTIDELAALYKIHRVTALRRVERARERLSSSTRAALATALNIGDETVASIVRLVESELDLSVERVLRVPE